MRGPVLEIARLHVVERPEIGIGVRRNLIVEGVDEIRVGGDVFQTVECGGPPLRSSVFDVVRNTGVEIDAVRRHEVSVRGNVRETVERRSTSLETTRLDVMRGPRIVRGEVL